MFDIAGREIATILSEEISAGSYTRQWNAQGDMPSGIYFYRLSVVPLARRDLVPVVSGRTSRFIYRNEETCFA